MARIPATPNTGKANRLFFQALGKYSESLIFPRHRKNNRLAFCISGTRQRAVLLEVLQLYIRAFSRKGLHIVPQFTYWKEGDILTFADTCWYSYIC